MSYLYLVRPRLRIETSAADYGAFVEDGEGDGEVIETADPLPFGVTGSLIERIAAITGKSNAETATMVLQDAAAVAVYVLGTTPKDLESLIQTASGLSFEMQNPVNEISTFVREISLLPDVAAGKCATQLALAFVEVGVRVS